MSKQYHFVVQGNDEGEMFIDFDTAVIVMPNGAVWNEDTNEWESEFDSADEFEKLTEQLTNLLMKHNKEIGS